MDKDGLEALETLYSYIDPFSDYHTFKDDLKDKEVIEKRLKALEIIKEKGVDIHFLGISKSPEEYMQHNVFNRYGYLTQEEYDLLKEVLL